MKTVTVITSHEYYMNQPSVFAFLNGKYVGCLIYPNGRNNPSVEYWSNATSSDSDRGFTVAEKEFSEKEISKIETLQSVINSLSLLIPNQPSWEIISSYSFKIKRGKAYEEYKAKKEAQELKIKEYFSSIEIYDRALSKAKADLRNILLK